MKQCVNSQKSVQIQMEVICRVKLYAFAFVLFGTVCFALDYYHSNTCRTMDIIVQDVNMALLQKRLFQMACHTEKRYFTEYIVIQQESRMSPISKLLIVNAIMKMHFRLRGHHIRHNIL